MPHIAGASWAMLWFRINEIKNPTKEEFREKLPAVTHVDGSARVQTVYSHTQIHDLLKFERLGYRKITDHCSREIRHGRMSRTDAVKLEHDFINNTVNIMPFFNWLNVSKTGVEWFIEHKLLNSKKLISDCNVESKKYNCPQKVKSLLVNASEPDENFITYSKGIEI